MQTIMMIIFIIVEIEMIIAYIYINKDIDPKRKAKKIKIFGLQIHSPLLLYLLHSFSSF